MSRCGNSTSNCSMSGWNSITAFTHCTLVLLHPLVEHFLAILLHSLIAHLCYSIHSKELKSDFVPCVELSGFKLKCVPTHKYLGFHIATDRRDDRSIRQQCRNMYSRGNTIIRNFKHCSDAVKCQLFKSFCTSFYCASLWSSYTIESLRHLKVAYNRIFRILMGLHHRARMSENFIKRGLDPFKVIIRKLSWSFRCRVLQSDNILLKTIVNSMYFYVVQVVQKVECCYSKPQVMSVIPYSK